MTAAESIAIDKGAGLDFPVKNMFLRNKKKTQFYLVTVQMDAPSVDLKRLKEMIGAAGNLSFGNPEQLWEILGVKPGAVTPFSLINDEEKRIEFYLDARAKGAKSISGHPLRNDKTTTVSMSDFEWFVRELGYELNYIDLPFKENSDK